MWSLYEDEKRLDPLVFSNGKTQEDIVSEVVKALKSGEKLIFIKGVCGTGKSAIALNIAKEIGRASIVVPIKSLQKQYADDYMIRMKIYKDLERRENLKIAMITGRVNHPCQYLKDNPQTEFKERDSKLHEIFEPREHAQKENATADNATIPCKISIKDKNYERIKRYLANNPNWRGDEHVNLKHLKRISVAPACIYWSPIVPAEMKPNLDALKKKSYSSINGEQVLYQRKPGCSYYAQFNAYCDADAIIFNSRQYLLETFLGRKPKTDIEIIDECDEFLDSFTTDGIINLNLLKYESSLMTTANEEQQEVLDELQENIFEALKELDELHAKDEREFSLKNTNMYNLVSFLCSADFEDFSFEEESYVLQCQETCQKFNGILEETYFSFSDSDEKKETILHLVTINLRKSLASLLEKNKAFVMMSGTLHSENVLRSIFGIDRFKIITAEAVNQGKINKIHTGFEADFKYENLQSGVKTRAHYLKALNKCVLTSKRPTLVHVTSFFDLPTPEEQEKYKLACLITQNDLRESQTYDSNSVQDFKKGLIDILFTTKCNRGVDFPKEMCNSVVITKFPYPNARDLFWKILKKDKPEVFWDFYMDKAIRELLQRIYRCVRSKDDHVDVLSPDIRVLNAVIA